MGFEICLKMPWRNGDDRPGYRTQDRKKQNLLPKPPCQPLRHGNKATIGNFSRDHKFLKIRMRPYSYVDLLRQLIKCGG